MPGPVWAKHEKGHDETPGICPQPRKTVTAPDEYLETEESAGGDAAEYSGREDAVSVDAKPSACRICHGITGDGLGSCFIG